MKEGAPGGSHPAVILAAGLSKRMGFPKMLLAQSGRLLVSDMIDCLRQTGWDSIAVVISLRKLEEVIEGLDKQIEILFNPNPEQGMISSIRLGLDWVGGCAVGLLTWPVDHPLVKIATLASLRSRCHADAVAVPTFDGRRGHPTWWGSDSWDALRSPLADGGARTVLRSPGVNVLEIAVDDEYILTNINSPEDAANHNLNEFQL